MPHPENGLYSKMTFPEQPYVAKIYPDAVKEIGSESHIYRLQTQNIPDNIHALLITHLAYRWIRLLFFISVHKQTTLLRKVIDNIEYRLIERKQILRYFSFLIHFSIPTVVILLLVIYISDLCGVIINQGRGL